MENQNDNIENTEQTSQKEIIVKTEPTQDIDPIVEFAQFLGGDK